MRDHQSIKPLHNGRVRYNGCVRYNRSRLRLRDILEYVGDTIRKTGFLHCIDGVVDCFG